MSNHLFYLLSDWYSKRDVAKWVLGTVYQTEGPAYRKAGAMMLFSDEGDQLGMLSGGCLESDIHLQARKVAVSGHPMTLTYDGSDEDDLAFQLGIGCGGVVHILLQPISALNDYLKLPELLDAMRSRTTGYYLQKVSRDSVNASFSTQAIPLKKTAKNSELIKDEDGDWLCTTIEAPLHLLIAGGGIDARPVATIAHQLGWQVTLWDPRPANGRPEYFPTVDCRLTCDRESLGLYCQQHSVQAAILMTHNVELDAQALSAMTNVQLKYLALLGPMNRRDRVITQSGIHLNDLAIPLAGPAGLNIGGDLPETIALSILSECQAAVNHRTAESLSDALLTNHPMRRAAS
ncbi:XdhC family protein [Vibrio maerlii]|uniref:XdhC family protein n=1 Tax=Vibrio maerlii TaxID=2231648 RepID=UPI000E3C075B|nr:XdhC/CoxI family protein [Vibrio maerlii]